MLFNSLVRSRLVYGSQTWNLKKRQINQLDSFYCNHLRKLVKNGYERKDKDNPENFALKYTNNDILRICDCEKLSDFNFRLQIAYLGHIARTTNTNPAKQLLFTETIINKRPVTCIDSLEQQVLKRIGEEKFIDRNEFYERCLAKTEHELFPKPVQHKTKRRKLARDHNKLRNNNENKSVRGEAI